MDELGRPVSRLDSPVTRNSFTPTQPSNSEVNLTSSSFDTVPPTQVVVTVGPEDVPLPASSFDSSAASFSSEPLEAGESSVGSRPGADNSYDVREFHSFNSVF